MSGVCVQVLSSIVDPVPLLPRVMPEGCWVGLVAHSAPITGKAEFSSAWQPRLLWLFRFRVRYPCSKTLMRGVAQVLSSNYTAALARLHYDVTSAALGTRNCTPGCAPPQLLSCQTCAADMLGACC